MDDAPRIQVVHATAPGCHWSWGYEAVMNRLRMVYGAQIDLHVRIGCPYEDWAQWLIDYEMSEDEAVEWINGEAAATMGVPLAPVKKGSAPPTVMPASLATIAALHQGEETGWRFNRALLRMYAVEAKDPSKPEQMQAAAKEAGLDIKRFQADLTKQEELRAEYEEQSRKGPPVHVGFYNFVVWDGGNRRVILDYSFDPRDIEGAIDYLADGKLKKQRPTDIVGYLAHHGLAPLAEIGRVFDFSDGAAALAAVEKLEKAGKLERVMLAGAPHWRAHA
ncbi:MAG TPA: DsbA family protein [Candidatus Thermoplasmatota archaeon]|nr:DsbA family protein [Candidatus Thermoplasmatota archaeon]